MKLLLILVAIGTVYGQTVAGQTTGGVPPQSTTAIGAFKKVPKLTMTLTCPGVPQDTSGNYLVVAGTSVACSFTLNVAPTVAASISMTSSDPTQFTVPATLTVPPGANSATFNVTATP